MKFTLTQIEQDPTYCFNNMTVRELERFKQAYYKRIEKEYARVQREREIEEQRLARQEEKLTAYYNQVLALWHRIKDLWMYPETKEFISAHGRSIGNTIHDLPVIWTGYESVNSIALRESDVQYTPCYEHFYPRQWAGEYIVGYLLENQGISMKSLLKILEIFRLVHKVTSTENRELMKYQSVKDFISPKSSYNAAGIELRQVKDTGIEFVWF